MADGTGGTVEISAERDGRHLRARVVDDGVGMPAPGATSGRRGEMSGLGTQIVGTLVQNELQGTIEWRPREGGGTEVVLDVELRDRKRERVDY